MNAVAPSAAMRETSIAAGTTIPFDAALRFEREMLAAPRTSDPCHSGASMHLVIWRTHQALIVPSGMPRIKHFDHAATVMAAQGWPVHERDTGGDVTPQFRGMLNISMSFTLDDKERNIAAAYGRLTHPVISFLKDQFGIDAYASSVSGAFCDGAHNIAIDGRKLAGTAQRWRLMPELQNQQRVTRVLGHVALVCGGDLTSALDAVNAFYRACEIDRMVVGDAHITLGQVIGQAQAEPHRLAQRLAAHLERLAF